MTSPRAAFHPLGRITALACMVLLTASVSAVSGPGPDSFLPSDLYIDPFRGADHNNGAENRPFKTLSRAIAALPELLKQSVTIHLAGGTYLDTGGHDMPTNTLVLMRRMRPGVEVRLVGDLAAPRVPPILGWVDGLAVVRATEGRWWIEGVQIGTHHLQQRRGIMVEGPAQVTLKTVSFRTRSLSDAGIYASRGGQVFLRGSIELNEHLHGSAEPETFSGIIATDHGLVRFVEREKASLQLGNGTLSASYYGVIELGCDSARITSWTEQGNCLAVNNSGRIDLHGTPTHLCARQKQNTPIGLEHDGHVLAEGARISIEGTNNHAIVLQKASTLTCNDVDLRGKFDLTLEAMSGSLFVGSFLGNISGIKATTGATVHLETLPEKPAPEISVSKGGLVSLPDRTLSSIKDKSNSRNQAMDVPTADGEHRVVLSN